MEPLTQDEIRQVNQKIAALGPDQMEKKNEAFVAYTGGGDAWTTYARKWIAQ